jgi:ribose transport system substrate-binding protein
LDQGVYSISSSSGNTHTQIASSSEALGRSQAEAAVEWVTDHLDGKGNVVIFNNGLEDPSAKEWYEAALEVFKNTEGITIVADEQVGFTPEEGANKMATILQAHPDVNVVIGFSSIVAGALSTFETAGRGSDPTVYLTSTNTSGDLIKRIADGDNTILRSAWAEPWPIYGYAAGVFAADWLAGKSVPKLISPPTGGFVNINAPDVAAAWLKDMADPAAAWENDRDKYIALWGNISYETRVDYWREDVLEPSKYIGD